MILREPAADLAVCQALISSYRNVSPRSDTVLMGEVGLTGEIRPISFLETRVKEAIRQGFTTLCLPAGQSRLPDYHDISAISIGNVQELLDFLKS
jgi:DNA repair protein RadA/Sms